ncbi:MAG TPA: ABC transporter permease [Candidatus Solibacter sp.]|nr:ABC transporter permease [Candidatus Solibacter sp.]
MSAMMRDIRYALRQVRLNPTFFAIVVLTLGLGIGTNTAIFSMVDWLVLRSLPIRNPEQVHFLVFSRPGNNEVQFSYPEFAEMEKETPNIFSGITPYIFGGLEGAQNAPNGLTVDGVTRPVQNVYVDSTFFPLMGIAPAAGRFLLPEEDAHPSPVVILSYNYWQARLHGDAAIIGKAASINGHAVTIVGVAPKGFLGATPLVEAQAYLPLGMYGIERGVADDFLSNPKTRSMVLFARLKPGTTNAQMQSGLALIGERLLKEYPREGAIGELRARQLRPPGLISGDVNPLPKVAALFLTLAAMVLALACVNVANLFLVRGTGRQREMAVRAALGAGNPRLVRQLLTESLVVAGLGCAVGIALGLGASRLLASIPTQSELPFVLDFDFNWHAFAYAFLVAGLAALLVMIVPVMRVWRGNLQEILHEGGRTATGGRQRLRAVLVTGELAACLTLLIVSGLFVRSLRGVQHADLGFDPQSVINLSFDPNQVGYSEAQGRAFYSAMLERTRALPGVESASFASAVPLADNLSSVDLAIPGFTAPANQPGAHAFYDVVSTDYFRTMRITLLRGRAFGLGDNENSAPVAIINQALADRYWRGQDPLGRSFTSASDPKHPLTIVGVVRNVRMGQLYGEYDLVYYRPSAQTYEPMATLQIRSPRSPQDLVPEVRNIAETLAPAIPVYGVRTMSEALHGGNGLFFFEAGASLAATMGTLGLILALVGVYGLMSYAVSLRTQEIGIRIALGAQRGHILRMIGQQGLAIVGAGLALGLLAATGVSRLVSDFLVGVAPNDPVTYVGVSALLAAIALLANYIPVRRAARVNPMTALRRE